MSNQQDQNVLTPDSNGSIAKDGVAEFTVAGNRETEKPRIKQKAVMFPSGGWYETEDSSNESNKMKGFPYIRFDVFEIQRDAKEEETSDELLPVGQQAVRDGVDDTFKFLESGIGRALVGSSLANAAGAGDAVTGAIFVEGLTGGLASGKLLKEFDQALGGVLGTSGSVYETAKKRLKNFSTRRNISVAREYIILPIPDNIGISYDHQYQEIGLTNALGLMGMIAQAGKTRTGGEGGVALGTTDPFVMELAAAAGSKIPTMGTGSEKVLLFGTTGLAVNPQLEMIFTSTALRKFMLDFTLTPKNAKDSAALKEILSKLRFYAAPEIPESLSGRYFIPPAQFEVRFFHGNNNVNDNFFKTKKCVLQGISVDYTPNGYATHADGSPAQVRLQLTFVETSILSRKDLGADGEGEYR